MKGSTAKALLRSLKGKRKEIFLSRIGHETNGETLEKICKVFVENQDAVEADVVEACGLTKGQYFYSMEALGGHLLAFIGAKDLDSAHGIAYGAAKFLIDNKEPDAATDVIREAIQVAAEVEDFEQVLRLWKLVADIEPLPEMKGMQKKEARMLRKNLSDFEDLMEEFQEAREIKDVNERQRVMRIILDNELLTSEANALSKKAVKLFLKLTSLGRMYMRKWEESSLPQRHLVDLIAAEPWICPMQEVEMVQEYITLAGILLILNKSDEYQQVEEELTSLTLKSPKAEHERATFLLPTRLAAAIQKGDDEQTISCIESFYQYFEQQDNSDPYFVTGCLYRCLYGAISANHEKLRIKSLRSLSQQTKSDFKPAHFAMYRFLEIITAIEGGEWELAMQRLRNPKRRAVIEQVQGMRELLPFLTFLFSLWDKNPTMQFHLDGDAAATLIALTSSSEVLDYFDLLIWFEAKRSGRSMSEVIRNRANHS